MDSSSDGGSSSALVFSAVKAVKDLSATMLIEAQSYHATVLAVADPAYILSRPTPSDLMQRIRDIKKSLLHNMRYLCKVAHSNEIRDYPWVFHHNIAAVEAANVAEGDLVVIDGSDQRYSVTSAILSAIFSHFECGNLCQLYFDENVEIEGILFHTWAMLISMPECSIDEILEENIVTLANCNTIFKYIFNIVDAFKSVLKIVSSPHCYIKELMDRLLLMSNLIHFLYINFVGHRPELKGSICRCIIADHLPQSQVEAGYIYIHVDPLLKVLISIISGVSSPLLPIHYDIVQNLIIPLLKPNDFCDWKDQIPCLQMYYDSLCNLSLKLIEKDRDILSSYNSSSVLPAPPLSRSREPISHIIIRGIINSWPGARQSNSKKELLLLDGLEKILLRTNFEDIRKMYTSIMHVWLECLGEKKNFLVNQRAMQIFKVDHIVYLFCESTNKTAEDNVYIAYFYKKMLPALHFQGVNNWNVSVQKFAAVALKTLACVNEVQFRQSADELFGNGSAGGGGGGNQRLSGPWSGLPPRSPLHQVGRSASGIGVRLGWERTNWNLSYCGGGQSSNQLLFPGEAGNLISTTSPTNHTKIVTISQNIRSSRTMAFNTSGLSVAQPSGAFSAKRIIRQTPSKIIAGIGGIIGSDTSTSPPIGLGEEDRSALLDSPKASGFVILMKFIENFNHKEEDPLLESKAAQAALVPALLPNLTFFDLAFGKQLGQGTFSIVRFAKLIQPAVGQSHWPEVAVKIIGKNILQQHQYHYSVTREMAILQLFSHPGIARLLSCFSYNSSAYLVLEYASQGDLHSRILKYGSFTHLQCRFVTAELMTTLAYIHKLGFSFNDLKPENILITHLGHIKLTDLGACRPFTAETMHNLSINRASLDRLRNGDWKNQSLVSTRIVTSNVKHDSILSQDSEDTRYEGTYAYSPPELLFEIIPFHKHSDPESIDSWSLGCVMWFMLTGKPRYFGETKEEIISQMRRIDCLLPILEHHDKGCRHGGEGGRRRGIFEVHFAKNKDESEGVASDELEVDVMVEALNLKVGESDEDKRLNLRCIDMLKNLICVDYTNRRSILSLINHDYVKYGGAIGASLSSKLMSINSTSSCNSDKGIQPYSSGTVSAADSVDDLINPSTVHFRPGLLTPQSLEGLKDRSQASQDRDWARRQYSILWAPFHGEGCSSGPVDSAEMEKKQLEIKKNSKFYSFNSIQETTFERTSSFL